MIDQYVLCSTEGLSADKKVIFRAWNGSLTTDLSKAQLLDVGEANGFVESLPSPKRFKAVAYETVDFILNELPKLIQAELERNER